MHGSDAMTKLQPSRNHRLRDVSALVIAAVCAACEVAPPAPMSAWTVEAKCPGTDEPNHFFPDGVLRPYNHSQNDEEFRDELSALLRQGGTPTLSCGPVDDSYRFIWFPANRPVLAVTARQTIDGFALDVLTFPDPRHDDVFRAPTRSARELRGNEALELRRAIETMNLWTIPAAQASTASDGAQWIMEGRKGGAYRVVIRTNFRDEPFEEAGRTFVKLAGLNVPVEMQAESLPPRTP